LPPCWQGKRCSSTLLQRASAFQHASRTFCFGLPCWHTRKRRENRDSMVRPSSEAGECCAQLSQVYLSSGWLRITEISRQTCFVNGGRITSANFEVLTEHFAGLAVCLALVTGTLVEGFRDFVVVALFMVLVSSCTCGAFNDKTLHITCSIPSPGGLFRGWSYHSYFLRDRTRLRRFSSCVQLALHAPHAPLSIQSSPDSRSCFCFNICTMHAVLKPSTHSDSMLRFFVAGLNLG
jgi:hypothetical protein